MSDALFLLADLGSPEVGDEVVLDGPEGHHAAVVRRIRIDEVVLLTDGSGAGVRGRVVAADKTGLRVEVVERLAERTRSQRFVAVQALAKGDRSELAVEMLTEVGVAEIVPWQASRSIVRWSGDRADKALARWRSTVREAAKQSRRLSVPDVSPLVSTRQLTTRLAAADLALVLHEDADERLADVVLPDSGEVVLVVGPEGGISPDELATFRAAGARVVLVADHVLRTSTAGVVALAALVNR